MKTKIIQLLKKVFPRLAVTYVRWRSSIPDGRQPMMTPMGFKLIGNPTMESGSFEPGETKIFLKLLESVDVVINVGANIGYYCCMALQHKKYVVAFEPMAQNLNYLMRNVTANGWQSKIEIFPVALCDKIGVVDIYGGGSGASMVEAWGGVSKYFSTLVPCSTMDVALGSRFNGQRCLIMADIEGAEKLMLEGASLMFTARPKPIWFVEISISAHQPGSRRNPNLLSTFEEFWSRGYQAWTTHKENRIVTKDEIEKIISTGIDTLWADTFLFIDKNEHHDFEVLKYLSITTVDHIR